MSMEEVSMYADELRDLRQAIETYARLAPLDLLKPHEIQRDLLAIADGEEWPSATKVCRCKPTPYTPAGWAAVADDCPLHGAESEKP